ncbi:MAG TPA: hypothetical protein VF094_03680 [Gaiellaceae bacterium]
MSVIATTQTHLATTGTLIRLPAARVVPAQRILAVEFGSPAGHTWTAIGGGETVAAAIASARESCPDDTAWYPLHWNDLYGD